LPRIARGSRIVAGNSLLCAFEGPPIDCIPRPARHFWCLAGDSLPPKMKKGRRLPGVLFFLGGKMF
jgi:hypothetical protein